MINLCTGCRVQLSSMMVGAYPVCKPCANKTMIGIQSGPWEIVGQPAASTTSWWNNPLVIIGGIAALSLVAFMTYMEYENTESDDGRANWLKKPVTQKERSDYIKWRQSRQQKDHEMARRMMSQEKWRGRTAEEEKKENARQWWEKV